MSDYFQRVTLLNQAYDKLDGLKRDWDDGHYDPLDAGVISRARSFIEAIPTACFNSMEMALMHEGTLQLNFTSQHDYIEANFEPGGGFSLMLVKNNATPAEVLKLLSEEQP